MSYRVLRRPHRTALGALTPEVPAPAPGRPQVPIYPFTISSPYGAIRRSPADGACGVGTYPCVHPGIDVAGAQGTPVVAPASGQIVAVADGTASPYGGYGPWLVEIRGDDGRFHLLAHLDPRTRSMAELGEGHRRRPDRHGVGGPAYALGGPEEDHPGLRQGRAQRRQQPRSPALARRRSPRRDRQGAPGRLGRAARRAARRATSLITRSSERRGARAAARRPSDRRPHRCRG